MMPRPSTKSIADAWRRAVTLACEWERTTNDADVVGGESRGFFAHAPDELHGRRCYLKPTVRSGSERMKRAAREKVASDLAHDLEVRVPPVILTEPTGIDELPPRSERFICASLVMYPTQFPWSHVRQLLEQTSDSLDAPELVSSMPKDAARAFAFDTWVAALDHKDHPANIVYGYGDPDGLAPGYVFLDYAMSLGFDGDWGGDHRSEVKPAGFPPRMLAALDTLVLEETVRQIEQYQETELRNVVGRIPAPYLSRTESDCICDNLIRRQKLLRDALGSYL